LVGVAGHLQTRYRIHGQPHGAAGAVPIRVQLARCITRHTNELIGIALAPHTRGDQPVHGSPAASGGDVGDGLAHAFPLGVNPLSVTRCQIWSSFSSCLAVDRGPFCSNRFIVWTKPRSQSFMRVLSNWTLLIPRDGTDNMQYTHIHVCVKRIFYNFLVTLDFEIACMMYR
jgi:hypothetical protein